MLYRLWFKIMTKETSLEIAISAHWNRRLIHIPVFQNVLSSAYLSTFLIGYGAPKKIIICTQVFYLSLLFLRFTSSEYFGHSTFTFHSFYAQCFLAVYEMRRCESMIVLLLAKTLFALGWDGRNSPTTQEAVWLCRTPDEWNNTSKKSLIPSQHTHGCIYDSEAGKREAPFAIGLVGITRLPFPPQCRRLRHHCSRTL